MMHHLGRAPVHENGDDMPGKRSKPSAVNEARVAAYVSQLKAAQTIESFEHLFKTLAADPELKAADLIAIANRYAVGGIKATSRRAALDRIRKRHVELRRIKGDLEIAAKTRPW